MEPDFTIEEIINLMKKTKKTDAMFKPLKKLKIAVESIGIAAVSFVPTKRVLVFHFGLGNDLDKQFINETNPVNLSQNINIIPGHAYCILNFINEQSAAEYLSVKQNMQDKPVFYESINYQNLSRVLVFLYCKQQFMKQTDVIQVPNCQSKFVQGTIPGLIIVEDVMTKQEQNELLQFIDKGNWEKLNNRRVQHFGFQFKYGRNQIDKNQNKGQLPHFFDPLLKKLKEIHILKGIDFDQLTINDYFAGNGIPAHFDTHSPFQEVFIAVSILSGLVMQFKKYDGEQRMAYLKERSVTIFSGEARYAWIHGISCRKVDMVDGQMMHRSRRLSLTFRKIKLTPCTCPYYFYCDSQGYNQQTMKKNNPLLKKYLSEQHNKQLSHYSSSQIQKQYVEKAYNGFGFDFHNKVIDEIRQYMQSQIKVGDIVLDVGCGNGEYAQYLKSCSNYIGIEKCTVMKPVDNQLHMDCLRLGFRNQTVDVILLIAVLHHFASEQTRLQALREAYRVLKFNGILYLTVMSYEHKTQIYSTPETLLQYCLPSCKINQKEQLAIKLQTQSPKIEQRGQVYKRYYHLFTVAEITYLLQKSEFKIIQQKLSKQNIVINAVKYQQQ